MLPIYKKGVRYVTGSFFIRTKTQATIAWIFGVILVCLMFVGLYSINIFFTTSTLDPHTLSTKTANVKDKEANSNIELKKQLKNNVIRNTSHTDVNQFKDKSALKVEPYWITKFSVPLISGFSFGFVGSIPVAGPTSAMVLKLGIQGKYWAGHAVALGGAIAEALYAGIAFWGFGSFLAGLQFLLPLSKVLAAFVLLIIGIVFLRLDIHSPMDKDNDLAQMPSPKSARSELMKNVLLGLTMSGINPALLATYTGAIATIYGTGWLVFTKLLAMVFSIGVCLGIFTWFSILLRVLKKYKQRLKSRTLGHVMKSMGIFLMLVGILCARSSYIYFFYGD